VQQFTFDRYDTFDWYLSLGPLANINAKYLHGKIPTWNDYVAHPDYDEFWKRQTMIPHLTSVKVPTLNVAGWWDQEDFYGPVAIYDALEKHDTQGINYLVVGPWNHGGWTRTGEALGPLLRQRHRRVLPRPGAGAVLRLLPQGQGRAQLPRSAHLRVGQQPVAAMGTVAAEAGPGRRPDFGASESLAFGDGGRRRAVGPCSFVPTPHPCRIDSVRSAHHFRAVRVVDLAIEDQRCGRRSDVRLEKHCADCRRGIAGEVMAHSSPRRPAPTPTGSSS
jgi:hypothetical protein